MDKQKDFEKGWEEYMAKKKQEIEELGQDIYDNCPDLCENGCGGKPCYKCIAESLHNDGYRKIPKNAVVLTKKEFEFMCVDTKAVREKEVKQARKETAEKILNELYVQFSADYLVGLRNEYKDWKYADLIKRYAKSVGVEIKE